MTPAGACPHSGEVARLMKDMYDGDQFHAGITIRIRDLEGDMELIQQWREQIHPDILRVVGVVNEMATVQRERDRAASAEEERREKERAKLKTYIGIIAAAVSSVPIIWDFIKVHLGILK